MRYVTKYPRLYIADDCAFDAKSQRDTIDVTVVDAVPQKTGLLDAAGEPLYRVPDQKEIGFYRLSEGK